MDRKATEALLALPASQDCVEMMDRTVFLDSREPRVIRVIEVLMDCLVKTVLLDRGEIGDLTEARAARVLKVTRESRDHVERMVEMVCRECLVIMVQRARRERLEKMACLVRLG